LEVKRIPGGQPHMMKVIAPFRIHVIGKANINQVGNLPQILLQVNGSNVTVEGLAFDAHD